MVLLGGAFVVVARGIQGHQVGERCRGRVAVQAVARQAGTKNVSRVKLARGESRMVCKRTRARGYKIKKQRAERGRSEVGGDGVGVNLYIGEGV